MKTLRVALLAIFTLIISSSLVVPLTGITYANIQYPVANQDSTLILAQGISYHSFLPLVSYQLGGVYYVSPNGSDNNPGTFNLPWRTIGKAASMVEPGDILYIRGGIYYEAVRFNTSGTISMPIRITAYPGENPIMDGGNTIPGEGGGLLSIWGNYIYASGIEVRNSAYDGIQVLGNYDVVDKMYVHHCQKKGILINRGQYSTVKNNLIWRNSVLNEYGHSDTWSSGITAGRDGVSYATILHNTVWENWGQGINTYEADHTVIEDNIIHDNFASNIYIHDATNILCQRNFIYTDPTSYVFPYGDHNGIMMGDERDTPSANITIINNISFGNDLNYALFKGTNVINNVLVANNTFINGITGGVLLRGYHQNIYFVNNLIQQDGLPPLIVIALDPDVSFSNNLWSKIPPPEASSPRDIIGDPLLAHTVDLYSPEWFMLTSVSPAIDGALSLPEVFVDYFGINREAPPDVGANEFFQDP